MRKRSKFARLLMLLLLLPILGAAGLWWSTPDASQWLREDPERTRYMQLRARALGRPEDSFSLQWAPLETVSPLLACSVVKAEDRGFFRHRGVEWDVTLQVARKWLGGSATRGGSTISQQLARNLYLSPERTAVRKLRELLAANELETELDKRRILELYLNTVEWAEGVWGVRSASRHYFNKEPGELDAFEATFLASLLAAPREPLLGSNAQRARVVQFRVLNQLLDSGLLDANEHSRRRTQVGALYKRLAQGQGVEEALAAERSDLPVTPGGHSRPDAMDAVLRQECGLARELAAHQLRQRAASATLEP